MNLEEAVSFINPPMISTTIEGGIEWPA